MRNLIPAGTVVETSETGSLAICDCDEQRPDDRLLAHGRRDGTDRQLLYITRDGTATNSYADGVMGVTDADAQAAEIDDEPFCEACGDYVRGWLHTAD